MADKPEKKERTSPEWVEVGLPDGMGSFAFISGRVAYRLKGPGPHKILQQDYDRIPELNKLPRWTRSTRGLRPTDTTEEN